MNITVNSTIDAVLSELVKDISKLGGHGVQGAIENHKEYSSFVNWGTNKMDGRFFLENSIPGIEAIALEIYAKLPDIPTDEDFKKANDEIMKRGLFEEIIPRTPRSNIDHVHMQDDYEIHVSESY